MKTMSSKILLIAFIVTVGAAYLYGFLFLTCPDDKKMCPDGASVGRILPNCEFDNCPSCRTDAECKSAYACTDGTCVLVGEPLDCSPMSMF